LNVSGDAIVLTLALQFEAPCEVVLNQTDADDEIVDPNTANWLQMFELLRKRLDTEEKLDAPVQPRRNVETEPEAVLVHDIANGRRVPVEEEFP
jgi:hypothetical protein